MFRAIFKKIPETLKPFFFRRLKPGKKIFTPCDLDISLTSANKSNVLKKAYYYGVMSYEIETMRLIRVLSEGVDIFFDIGANVGIYSYVFTRFNSNSAIYAIEPVTENADYIDSIIELNQLKKITLVRKAFSNVEKKVKIYIPNVNGYTETASLKNRFYGSTGVFKSTEKHIENVICTTLDVFSSDIDKTKKEFLLKIDVEELELEVLMGGRMFLEKYSPDIILEILLNSDNNYKIFNYLEGIGYQAYLITTGGLIPTNIPLPIRERVADRTIYKNHYFSKKDTNAVQNLSKSAFGRFYDS
jgi:FkbM family methyltransferase